MGVALDMTKAYLDSKGIKYTMAREDCIKVGFGGLKNKGSIEIFVRFDDNDRTVAISSFNICQIPEDKKPNLYRLCSDLNERYRWVKFYVDENDNTITAEDDAVVQPDTSGEELFELVARMTQIVDGAYPDLMKALWA